MLTATPDPACEQVLDWFARFSGSTIPANRRSELEAGIRRVMQANRIASPERLRDSLSFDSHIRDALVAEFTIGETYFFRDPVHFELIRQQVLPHFRAARPPGAIFRAWSAGCASGEEAYSLAILLEEEGMADRAQILATDISRLALQKARRARYGAWSFRNAAGEAAKRHCQQRGADFVLADRIRSHVRFDYDNLAGAPAAEAGDSTAMDLILCRNVMIYFDAATVRRLAQRFFDALVPGGHLIVGPSDPPLWDMAPFEVATTDGGIVYWRPLARRKATAAPLKSAMPAARQALPATRPAPPRRAGRRASPAPSPVRPAAADPLLQARAAYGIGAHARVLDLTKNLDHHPEACALRIRAAANLGAADLLSLAETAAAAHPLHAELQYLHAVVLLGQRRYEAACAVARRIVYLDGSLVMGHFMLATALTLAGQKAAACRSYRKVEALCTGLPPDEKIAFADGETAAMLCAAARLQLQAAAPAPAGSRDATASRIADR